MASSGWSFDSVFSDSKYRCFSSPFFSLDRDADQVFALEVAAKNLFGERILNVLLDRTTKGTGAEVRVRSLLDQELLGFGRDLDLQAMVGQTTRHLPQLELDNRFQVLPAQRAEDDDVVQSADELGPEVTLQLLHHRVLDRLIVTLLGTPLVLVERRPKSGPPPLIRSEPMLLVMIMTTLRKSTCRPNESVSRPSSMI